MGAIVVVLLSLAIWSCGTQSTRSDMVEDISSPAPEKAAAAAVSVPSANVESSHFRSSLQTQLSDAIKAQRDQDIYTLSGQILLQNSTDLQALNAMALYYYKKGRFSAAEFLLKKASAAHPQSSEVKSNLGLIHLAQNERREALLSFRKALELKSSDPVAAANIGSLFIEAKDYSKAQIALETAYQKGWRDPKVLVNYGIALTANGQYAKAEEIYKSVMKDQSSSKELLYNLSVLQIEHLKKNKEGLETINRLKFIGVPTELKKNVSNLEAKAKSGPH